MTAAVPTPADKIVDALQDGWRAMQRHHRDLPAVVIVIGPGEGVKWGHFLRNGWQVDNPARSGTMPRSEVQISGESLGRPAEDTFATLMHEAAHALAFARGIKETSREHRYHNDHFKRLAQELLLEVEKRTEARGWAHTRISDAARQRYSAEIELLASAQHKARAPRRRLPNYAPARKFRVTLECKCSRRVAVAPGVADMGPIVCGLCGKEFVET